MSPSAGWTLNCGLTSTTWDAATGWKYFLKKHFCPFPFFLHISQETKRHEMNRLYVSIYFHQNTILIIVAVVFILSRKDHHSWDCFINHFIKVVCKKIKEVTRTKASIILQYTGSIIGIIIIIIAMDTSNMTLNLFHLYNHKSLSHSRTHAHAQTPQPSSTRLRSWGQVYWLNHTTFSFSF